MKKTALILTFALAALPMAFGRAQRAGAGAGSLHRGAGSAYGRAGGAYGRAGGAYAGRYGAIGGANRSGGVIFGTPGTGEPPCLLR